MPTLKDILLDPAVKDDVVHDCARLIDEEVHDKSGLTGLAVKATFAIVKKLRPNMVEHQVEDLLPDFCTKLEPFWTDYESKGGGKPISDYIAGRKAEVAEALLSITDGRASRSKNTTIRKAYEKLRPQARKHCEEAMPRVGRLVERYTKKKA